MTSTVTLETVEIQNPPLLELLLKLSVAFKVLYIQPPKSNKIGPPAKLTQPAGESYQLELENYNEELRFLNSDKDSDWMEVYFKAALRFSDNEWGPAGYISNQIIPPASSTKTKRKFSDMVSSNTRHSQGGTFLPSDQSAEEDEVQDTTEDEDDEDDEDYDEENDEKNDEEYDQPPASRRRLD